MEHEHRNISVAMLSSDKLVRTTNKGQVLLTQVKHLWSSSGQDLMSLATVWLPKTNEFYKKECQGKSPASADVASICINEWSHKCDISSLHLRGLTLRSAAGHIAERHYQQ